MILIPESLSECIDILCSECGAKNTEFCRYPGKAKNEGMRA